MRLFHLIIVLLACVPLAGPGSAAESLVPQASWISDQEARIQLAQVNFYLGRLDQAAVVYRDLLEKSPRSQELHAGLAEVELASGHAAAARNHFAKAVELEPENQALKLRQAQAMNLWGDFYRMESIYRDFLQHHPKDMDVRLRLARTLMSQQRFEEARAMYLWLLEQGAPRREVLAALSQVQWEAGDLLGCLDYGREALALAPDQAELLALLGKANLRLGRYRDAMDFYRRLASQEGSRASGLTGMGLVHKALGEQDQARACFAKAHAVDPQAAQAQFNHLGKRQAGSASFLAQLTRPGSLPPPILASWAGVFAEQGLYDQAIACHRAALRDDPDYFPSRMALGELLGIGKRFQEAEQVLTDLARDFPGASKVLLTRARVLAWSRQYRKAIEQYLAIHRLNPHDSLPLREAARTAVWGKDMARARQLYAAIWDPPVDREMEDLARRWSLADPKSMPSSPPAKASDPEPTRLYDRLSQAVARTDAKVPRELAKETSLDLIRLRGIYRVQKAAGLELAGKEAFWGRRFWEARRLYRELVTLQPGNQEAAFDLAQAQCALNLADEQKASYRRLLALDPMHSLAGDALARLERRSMPLLGAGYSFWKEDGYGELAHIDRQQAELKLETPILGRFELDAALISWREQPDRYRGDARANGFRLGGQGILTPWLKAAASWTHKNYNHDELGSRDSASAHVWIKAQDYLSLGLGVQRQEALQNAFALRQGIMVNDWWLGLDSQITRRLAASLRLGLLDYSDRNQGDRERLEVSYGLSDHPRELKLVMEVERRDHQEEAREIYQGGELTDITHPYWAPVDWWGGALGLRWRHDLSENQFCGAERHYYELGLRLSDDNDANVGWQAEAGWNYEFADHWKAELKGLLHRSRMWDAEGVWLSLEYRF